MIELICYDCGKFNKRRMRPVVNSPEWCKPKGGLWTSPVGCEESWAAWCESEAFRKLETSFYLLYGGRTLVIDSQEDLIPHAVIESSYGRKMFMDYEALSKEFDAIHLTAAGQWSTRLPDHGPDLYGWDVETVFVMNPDSVSECQDVGALLEDKP